MAKETTTGGPLYGTTSEGYALPETPSPQGAPPADPQAEPTIASVGNGAFLFSGAPSAQYASTAEPASDFASFAAVLALLLLLPK